MFFGLVFFFRFVAAKPPPLPNKNRTSMKDYDSNHLWEIVWGIKLCQSNIMEKHEDWTSRHFGFNLRPFWHWTHIVLHVQQPLSRAVISQNLKLNLYFLFFFFELKWLSTVPLNEFRSYNGVRFCKGTMDIIGFPIFLDRKHLAQLNIAHSTKLTFTHSHNWPFCTHHDITHGSVLSCVGCDDNVHVLDNTLEGLVHRLTVQLKGQKSQVHLVHE